MAGTPRLHAEETKQPPFYAMLWLNGKLKGLTPASKPPKGDDLHITGPLLLFSLADILPDSSKQALDGKMKSAGYLTPTDLREKGIQVQFLRSKSEVRLVYRSGKPRTKAASLTSLNMPQGDTLLGKLNDPLNLQSPGFDGHIETIKDTTADSAKTPTPKSETYSPTDSR